MRVVAKLYVNKENHELFFDLTKKLIDGTLAEEGNIAYDLVADVNDDTCYVFIENWKDQEALKLHENSAHYKKYLPKIGELCYQKPVIEVYKEL